MKKASIIFILLIITYIFFHISNTKPITLNKIYIINLDKSVDRYNVMDKNLNALDLAVKHSRFKAIDGKTVKFINLDTKEILTGAEILDKKLILKGQYNIICSDEDPNDIITVKLSWEQFHLRGIGEIGHTCSSRKIWQEIIKNNYKNTLILEDDLSFDNDFKNLLTRNLNNAPLDYDILYLNVWDHWTSYTYKKKINNGFARRILNIFDQYIRNIFWKKIRRNIVSAKSYIISKSAAEKLLQYTKKLPDNILVTDVTLSLLIEDEKLIAYTSKPLLTEDNGLFHSDVENLNNIK